MMMIYTFPNNFKIFLLVDRVEVYEMLIGNIIFFHLILIYNYKYIYDLF